MDKHISLAIYQEKYKQKLFEFQLPPEQAGFTGLPEEMLEAVLEDENKFAVVITDGEMPIGFFVLHIGEGIADFYSEYPDVMLLRAFSVNYACQGKGYAKAAMALLPEFVRSQFPNIKRIVLAVNEQNIPADRLYSQAGFKDEGLRRSGKKGVQKILQYDLSPADRITSLQHHDLNLQDKLAFMQKLPEEELRRELIRIFSTSGLLMSVFEKARALGPFPYYVGAGCLVQTVWNELTGRTLDYGIADIDIIYYDDTDLSYAAENIMVDKGKALFAHLLIPVDVKNQARVHVWYADKFGIELQPYASLEAAIDTWPTTATCLGARFDDDGNWCIYAPFGLADLFRLTVRPNKVLINESIYNTKALKWKTKWPELHIIPWADE